jgi:hypothetical protein
LSQKIYRIPIILDNLLKLFREVIRVYSQNYVKPINKLRSNMQMCIEVKAGCTYTCSHHCKVNV